MLTLSDSVTHKTVRASCDANHQPRPKNPSSSTGGDSKITGNLRLQSKQEGSPEIPFLNTVEKTGKGYDWGFSNIDKWPFSL